ncbi:hypothetical protein B0I72DRAFT_167330 [Yarrowia lipolytica]|jgi:hypothetical protein|uniref:PH domain-containing protein n=1 Tax=Yarrowia lipolytica TaxID=4952 RepID=A0A371C4Y6_YARLL|nr:hypothetical protein B0I71DRAFT_132677 [Yarrowia lipolytica]RDW33969.1 hypothetical protein B0I72DRAFT_167330 [Yarrowia lipolytica]RDW41583.1 hypothetical protein B0I73DRAFT_128501 [Yarrowia lipolytica]RDW44630.1 hypothetical protein B0I74DRAFT_140140 [Yarrowia lipolytica]RDW51571.1 hypothetical protein B0I75DRAFT_139687 [Yarrowia lipolytica]
MLAPVPVGGETPILLPNELLLQKFSSKSSGYRQSIIRLHQQRQLEQDKLRQEKERQREEKRQRERHQQAKKNPGGSERDRFVASLKKGLKKWASESVPDASGAREMSLRTDTPRPTTAGTHRASNTTTPTSNTIRPITSDAPASSLATHTITQAAPRFNLSLLKNLLPTYAPPEAAVSYLTNDTETGSVWITTERLIFVPQKAGHKGFYVHIDNLDCMKVVCMAVCDVDYDYWSHPQLSKKPYFFVAYEGTNFLTVPFSTHARASSFLKLLSNIRFEHMVKSCLPPPYMSCVVCSSECNMDAEADSSGGSSSESSSCRSSISESDLERIDSTSTTATSTISSTPCLCHDDWVHEDNVLPTYQDSEHALKLYLIKRGLLQPEEHFERGTHAQASNILAQANAPPSNEMDAATERDVQRRVGPPVHAVGDVSYPLVWF